MTVLYKAPAVSGGVLFGRDAATLAPMPHTSLNYGPQPWRVPRLRQPGIHYMAGLSQVGSVQWFSGAWLPPPLIPRATTRTRAVGGALGAGTASAATQHVASARVPRSIT